MEYHALRRMHADEVPWSPSLPMVAYSGNIGGLNCHLVWAGVTGLVTKTLSTICQPGSDPRYKVNNVATTARFKIRHPFQSTILLIVYQCRIRIRLNHRLRARSCNLGWYGRGIWIHGRQGLGIKCMNLYDELLFLKDRRCISEYQMHFSPPTDPGQLR